MKIRLFLIVSMMLAALITNGQPHSKPLKEKKLTREERKKMTPEQRIVRANQRTIKKKKKDVTAADKVKAEKRENRKSRRIREDD
jgi:hypothetical protein